MNKSHKGSLGLLIEKGRFGDKRGKSDLKEGNRNLP
jgi:hypothetical protein